MFCASCGSNLPDGSRFCPSCGVGVLSVTAPPTETVPPLSTEKPGGQPSPISPMEPMRGTTVPDPLDQAKPIANKEFRATLLECYLQWMTSQELSGWLQEIGQHPKGSVEEKKARIREHTQYLSMSPEKFPEQTLNYLRMLNRSDILSDICLRLGLDGDGSKNALFRRIYREAGYREDWLKPIPNASPINKQTVLQFVKWYPIIKWSDYEKDYYQDFFDEMTEVFSSENVHDQLPVAHGNTLKIDFHIGLPQSEGVGIEFKLPASNSEVQRALGQMDQYLNRYKSDLIVVLIPHLLKKSDEILFLEELERKGIQIAVKSGA